MNYLFRLLSPNEIECRIAICNQWGVQVLLYKDARADMNILDESVGSLNWKREHISIDGRLYCTVLIYDPDKNEWISKQDVGTESNTEKEKGQASDAFKRACTNWGIGRELYSCPSLFIYSQNLKTLRQENGKWKCNDSFKVVDIKYDLNNTISYLKILNQKTNQFIEFNS